MFQKRSAQVQADRYTAGKYLTVSVQHRLSRMKRMWLSRANPTSLRAVPLRRQLQSTATEWLRPEACTLFGFRVSWKPCTVGYSPVRRALPLVDSYADLNDQ